MSRFVTGALLATCPTASQGLQVHRPATPGPTGTEYASPSAENYVPDDRTRIFRPHCPVSGDEANIHVSDLTHSFRSHCPVSEDEAAGCNPEYTYFYQATEDDSDTESVNSVEADSEVPTLQAGLQANQDAGIRCWKARSGDDRFTEAGAGTRGQANRCDD